MVEDEVADAVVDAVAVVVLDGLKCVGMVANEHIGTGVNELASFLALLGYGFRGMFAAPMEADDDIGFGLRLAQTEDSLAKRIDVFLTDTWLAGQEGIVFECQSQRGKQPDGSRAAADEYGPDGFFHILPGSYGCHSGFADMLPGVDEALASLVDAVVVGQV